VSTYSQVAKWLNNNQGVVGVAIFIVTLLLGWITGIFSSLRRRPNLKLSLIDGPTFCCNFEIGKTHGEYQIHRTAFALYLRVANIGSASTSIEQVSVGYRCNLRPFSILWLKHTVGRLWLHEQTAAIHDFQVKLGENIKFFPFLTQRSIISGHASETFLSPGQVTTGVVYFEQSDSWGGFMPRTKNSHVDIKISIRDAFGLRHVTRRKIPTVTLEEARRFNPSFGKTFSEIKGEVLPHDASS
jgi:hypothetical protein